MSDLMMIFILVGALFGMLAMGMWVGFALTLTGALGMVMFTSAPLGRSLQRHFGVTVTLGHWRRCPCSS